MPFSAGEKSSYNSGNAILQGWYGDGFTSFIPMLGRNNYSYPRHIVDDIRVGKTIAFTERYNLDLLLNVFNVANHQNIDGINTTAYAFASTAGTGGTGGTVTYQSAFRSVTNSNNSGFLFTPRQVEIWAKFNF